MQQSFQMVLGVPMHFSPAPEPEPANVEPKPKQEQKPKKTAVKRRPAPRPKPEPKPEHESRSIYTVFSKEKDAIIRSKYPTADTDQLAAELGVTRKQLTCRAQGLGVKKERSALRGGGSRVRIAWTPEMDDLIRKEYLTKSGYVVAELLGISQTSVCQRAKLLGVTKLTKYTDSLAQRRRGVPIKWTPEMDDYVRRNYRDTSLLTMSMHLGLSTPSICRRAKKLGVKKEGCARWPG